MLTAISLFQSISSVSCTEPTRPMPALLTSTSNRPKRSTPLPTAACTLATSAPPLRWHTSASPSSRATRRPPASLKSAPMPTAPRSPTTRTARTPAHRSTPPQRTGDPAGHCRGPPAAHVRQGPDPIRVTVSLAVPPIGVGSCGGGVPAVRSARLRGTRFHQDKGHLHLLLV